MQIFKVFFVFIFCSYSVLVICMDDGTKRAPTSFQSGAQHLLIQWLMERSAKKANTATLFQCVSQEPFKYSSTPDRKHLKIEYRIPDFSENDRYIKQRSKEIFCLNLEETVEKKETFFLPLSWKNTSSCCSQVCSNCVSSDKSIEVVLDGTNTINVIDVKSESLCFSRQFSQDISLFLIMLIKDNSTVLLHDFQGNIFAWNFKKDLLYQLYKEKKRWDKAYVCHAGDTLCLIAEKEAKARVPQEPQLWKCEVKNIFVNDAILGLIWNLQPKELFLLYQLHSFSEKGGQLDVRGDDEYHRSIRVTYECLPIEIRRLVCKYVDTHSLYFEKILQESNQQPGFSAWYSWCTIL